MNRLWVARVAIMAIVLSPQMMMKGSPKKKVKAESGRASADNPTLQIEPIDATRTLPEYFVGSPVELIYSMFVGGPPTNEFETSAEYDKRRSELQRPGLYPFLISGVSATYDADKAMFVVELTPKQVHPTDGKNQVSAFECESVLPEEQAAWITKHSFLAKDSFSARYNVVIDQPLGSNRVMVPLGRERAREAKPYLRAVVLVHLDAGVGLRPHCALAPARAALSAMPPLAREFIDHNWSQKIDLQRSAGDDLKNMDFALGERRLSRRHRLRAWEYAPATCPKLTRLRHSRRNSARTTAQPLTCSAKAHGPKSSGAPVATCAAQRRIRKCSRRDADRILDDAGGSAAGPKPGADRFSA